MVFDLLCIGSGPAGQRAAVQAAKVGKRVGIVEKRRVIGGICLDTGTIPSKTFREAVLAFGKQAEQFRSHHGFPPSERLTAGQLMSRVNAVVNREAEVVDRQLLRNDIEVLRGEAAFVDPHTIQITTETQTLHAKANHILIAVGTIPAPPPGVPCDGEVIITSDGVTDLSRLPRSMVVVGAGVIGIEYASMFGMLGVDVTLVDTRTRPLEFLDSEIVDELIHQMRNHNVVFRSGETVERLELSDGTPTRAIIHLESGKRLVSDLVLFSVGRMGATASLNVGAAGLEVDHRGRLTVDKYFRTNIPHIFAAGDVIGYPSLAATSSEQGTPGGLVCVSYSGATHGFTFSSRYLCDT